MSHTRAHKWSDWRVAVIENDEEDVITESRESYVFVNFISVVMSLIYKNAKI